MGIVYATFSIPENRNQSLVRTCVNGDDGNCVVVLCDWRMIMMPMNMVTVLKVKTEEKMLGGKGGKAKVNEAFEMNPNERGL